MRLCPRHPPGSWGPPCFLFYFSAMSVKLKRLQIQVHLAVRVCGGSDWWLWTNFQTWASGFIVFGSWLVVGMIFWTTFIFPHHQLIFWKIYVLVLTYFLFFKIGLDNFGQNLRYFLNSLKFFNNLIKILN